jgi:hypothetical protein
VLIAVQIKCVQRCGSPESLHFDVVYILLGHFNASSNMSTVNELTVSGGWMNSIVAAGLTANRRTHLRLQTGLDGYFDNWSVF